jgi:predicted esterase
VRRLQDDIGRLIEKSAMPQPIVVGFSQGGGVAAALAYDSGATLDVAAAVVIAGFIPDYIDFGRDDPPPALLLHGISDHRVGWRQTSRLSARLRSVGAHVDTHRFDGGHYVPTAILQHAAGWLRGQLLEASHCGRPANAAACSTTDCSSSVPMAQERFHSA